MKRYTYLDWLNGVDNISASKENFNLAEWAKVEVKRLEIYEEAANKQYNELIEAYKKGLEGSIDEEKYRRILILELEKALKNTHIQGKGLSPDLDYLNKQFADLERLNGIPIVMPYPKYPDTEEAQNAIKAMAYSRYYKFLLDQQEKEDSEIDSKQKGLTTKQQILLIHLLKKIGAISLTKIHQDETVQALVFSKLLSRDQSNVRKYLNQIPDQRYRATYFNETNLNAILPIAEKIGNPDLDEEIRSEIHSIKLSKKNI